MRWKPSDTVAARLTLLIVLALIPAVLTFTHVAVQQIRDQLESDRQKALALARTVAARQAALLPQLAEFFEVNGADEPAHVSERRFLRRTLIKA